MNYISVENNIMLKSKNNNSKGLLFLLIHLIIICNNNLFSNTINSPIEISDNKIASLRGELVKINQSKMTSVRLRRGYKSIIRSGQKLLKANPAAMNRFPLLLIIFKSQIKLLHLEKSVRNQDLILKTCKQLLTAPDKYADIRFDADFYSYLALQTEKEITAKVRINNLCNLVNTYKGTLAEAKSLMSVIKYTLKINAFELKEQLIKTLGENFPGNPEVISFLRKTVGTDKLEVLFSGSFTCLDKTTIKFPNDRIGHNYIVVFWSKNAPNVKHKLLELKEQQTQYPNRFEIFSLNTDELPDAGQSFLKEIGLKSVVLHLKGGAQNETYLSYVQDDPYALRVNEFGFTYLPPQMLIDNSKYLSNKKFSHHEKIPKYINLFAYPKITESDNHYKTQLQSFLIGDFLVESIEISDNQNMKDDLIPVELIKAIQSNFIQAPLRFRLTKFESQQYYENAEKLCEEALTKYPKAKNRWFVINRRIIALLGLWNLTNKKTYIQSAVNLSKILLSNELPKGADVIPRFAIAKQALRMEGVIPKKIISEFVLNCGGNESDGTAFASACVLAMHMGSRVLYEQYSKVVLENYSENPKLYSISALLKNRFHKFYKFKANPNFYIYQRLYRFVERNYMINHGLNPINPLLPNFSLKDLEGKLIHFPNLENEKLSILIFAEPPPSDNLHLPLHLYTPKKAPTKRNKNPLPTGIIPQVNNLAKNHVSNNIDVITAFISDDSKHIKKIAEKYNLQGKIVTVPNAFKNSVIQKLGVVSTNLFANIFLIRRNGTIAWQKNGLSYRVVYSISDLSLFALKTHIYQCELEAGYRELKNGFPSKAKTIFSGPFENSFSRKATAISHRWTGSQYYGRSIAQYELKQWDLALHDIETAISEHKKYFNHDVSSPCSSMINYEQLKSKICLRLGRTSESKQAGQRGHATPTDYATTYSRTRGYNKPYEVFDDKLKKYVNNLKL